MRHWVSPRLQGDRKPVPLVFPFPCQQTSGVNKNQGGQRDFKLNRSISSRVSLTKPTVAAKGFQLSRSGGCIPFLTETRISAWGRSTHFPRTVAGRLFLPCVNKRRVHFGTRKTLRALRQAMFSTLILKGTREKSAAAVGTVKDHPGCTLQARPVPSEEGRSWTWGASWSLRRCKT